MREGTLAAAVAVGFFAGIFLRKIKSFGQAFCAGGGSGEVVSLSCPFRILLDRFAVLRDTLTMRLGKNY